MNAKYHALIESLRKLFQEVNILVFDTWTRIASNQSSSILFVLLQTILRIVTRLFGAIFSVDYQLMKIRKSIDLELKKILMINQFEMKILSSFGQEIFKKGLVYIFCCEINIMVDEKYLNSI